MNIEKIREHYAHAREKHPYFCDMITCLSDVGSDTHLDIYRATLRAESENEAVEVGTLLGCEFYEAIQAYTHGDKAHAALGLAAGIVTAPLALVIWPAFLAWFMFHETEGDDL